MVFRSIKKGASRAGRSVRTGASRAGSAGGSGASRVGRSVRSGATRAGRSVSNGATKAGRGARSIGSSAASVAQEAGNRAAGLPEAGLNAIGVMPTKKLRLRVVVLANANGDPVLSVSGGRTPEQQVLHVIGVAQQIYRDHASVEIVAAGGTFVTVDTEPAPDEVLVVRCQGGAMKDDLGKAGRYFRRRAAGNRLGNVTGNGSPLTAFVVEDVVGKQGCSLGPLTDYVTVDVRGVARDETLAHEIGHALGLPHTGGAGSVVARSSARNLMQSSGGGRYLNRRQAVMVRNSRHVTFR